MERVLVVDDDRELCALVKKCMEQEGFQAETAYNGRDGVRLAEETPFSLVILDVMLPDLDGFEVLRRLRLAGNVPVLMLTAKGGEEDKVCGLRLGADDYLAKPFSLRELTARAGSLIRRYTTLNPAAAMGSLSFRGLEIDRDTHTVLRDGEPVALTGKEFGLLVFLASNPGRVFTKRQIYTQVWDDEYAFDDNNIMSFISRLRRKLEPDPEHPTYILTVRGVGYRFSGEV